MKIYVFMFMFLVVKIKCKNDCTTADDCDITGSVCEKWLCVCPPGFVANDLNTECLKIANGYGSSCTDNIQCSTCLKSGGICSNNTCVCCEGHHYFLGKCWKSAGFGEKCKHNENCFVSYDFEAAVCNKKKVCECSAGYYQREYSSCRRKSFSPGEPCGIALDCQYKYAVCTKDRKCGKNQTSLIDMKNVTKLQKMVPNLLNLSKVGDKCSSNNECPKNSECNERKICACKKGFYLNNNSCSPELGASCLSDKDCLGKNTMCRNGTYCVCKQGFVASENNQYCDKMSRYIGWSCLKDRECGFFGPGSSCLMKKCHCNNNTHYVEDVMYCWVTRYVGDSCIKNEDCGGVDTMICSEGICQCVADTHASSDKQICRKDSTNVGDQCEEDLDCKLENTYCHMTSHSCQCLKGYIYINGSCVSGAGGKCNTTSNCFAEGTYCLNKVCICPTNYVSSEDFKKCLPVVNKLYGNCSESVQCEEMEGICSESKCTCKNFYHYVENVKCFKSRFIGQKCTSNGNCTITKHSACSKGLCMCEPGYVFLQNGMVCSSGSHFKVQFISVIVVLLLTIIYI